MKNTFVIPVVVRQSMERVTEPITTITITPIVEVEENYVRFLCCVRFNRPGTWRLDLLTALETRALTTRPHRVYIKNIKI